jgi:hypothetical protein
MAKRNSDNATQGMFSIANLSGWASRLTLRPPGGVTIKSRQVTSVLKRDRPISLAPTPKPKGDK